MGTFLWVVSYDLESDDYSGFRTLMENRGYAYERDGQYKGPRLPFTTCWKFFSSHESEVGDIILQDVGMVAVATKSKITRIALIPAKTLFAFQYE